MITPIDDGRQLHITGDTAATIQADINTAVELIKIHAIEEGKHGILVTRHGPGNYTVAISSNVPYGQTLEKRTIALST